MTKTVKEIAAAIGGEVVGDGLVRINGVAGIQDAGEGDLTFLANQKYLGYLSTTGASAIITSRDTGPQPKTIIRTDNPSLAFTRAVEFLLPDRREHFKGIHPSACIGKDVSLGKDVALGPYVVIEDGVRIGDGCVIYAGTFIGRGSTIGARTVLYPHVTVIEGSALGAEVIIHSGTVIGSDGFGFVTVDGVHHKIPQIGTVVIEDEVEIGANVTIDRARFDRTIIGKGTKIDNLVQIGHNVRIGQHCLIVAQVGIAGSTVIGNNVIIAGQAATVGHITIGDNCVVMARSGVSKSLPAGSVVWGVPAKPVAEAKLINACIQSLPKWHETIKELKNRLAQLEKQK